MNDMLAALVPALAWALLDFVWQGLLIGWGAALLFALLRRARPQARYAAGCAILLLCVALPLAGTVQRLQDAGTSSGATAATTALMPLVLAGPGANSADATLAMPAPALLGPRLAAWEHALQSKLPLVMLFWSCGAGLLALRMMLGLAWVRRRSRPGDSRSDPAWQARCNALALRFGLARRVVLGLVDDLPGPVTAGWWRPVILVPASLATGMAPQLLEALLAHEMAHIRRHDYLVNLIQSAIEIVLFYHPTVWWLSNRIRVEREQIADDLAASMLGEPRRLALALSELDRFQLTTPQLAHAAHGGNLMLRIKRLVRPDTEPLNWKMALPILGLAGACAAFYANAQSVSPPVPPLPPAPPALPVLDLPPPPPAPPLPALRPPRAERLPRVPTLLAPPAPPAPPAAPAAPAAPAIRLSMAAPAAPATPAAPAAMAAAAAPAAPAAPLSRSWNVSKGNGMSFALVEGAERHGYMSGSSIDFQELELVKRKVGGDFLWFRKGGKSYLIQDADSLAKMKQAFAPVKRLGAEMDGHGKEMDKHGKAMEALGKQMAQAARVIEPNQAQLHETTRQMHDIARQQRQIGRQQAKLERKDDNSASVAERERLAREMAALEVKMGDLEREVERQHEKAAAAHDPMTAIGKQMNEAGKPMDALGKQMKVLGKQMETQTKAADKVMESVIDNAMGKGLAQPVNNS